MLNQLTSEVSAQASMLAAHHQQLQKLTSLTEELVRTLQTLHVANPPTNAMPSVPSPLPITPTLPPTSQGPRLSLPDKYDGSPERCKGFLMQCYLYIHQQPLTFPTDASQVSFICSLLTGRALDWATAIWEGNRLSFPTYDTFIRQFREVFEHSASGKEVGEELIALRQGNSTAADYTLTFRTLAAQTGWEDEPLRLLYRKGLNEELQSELACRDEGRTLEQFMELTIRIDNLMRSRRVHRSALPIHTESIRLFAIESPLNSVILGLPWLEKHNPRISWSSPQILQWSEFCHLHCLTSSPKPSALSREEKPENKDLSKLPVDYQDLSEAFSKIEALKLPPHRASDCAIDLIPGSAPPKGRIFPLSQPESETMKQYIEEELAKGFIVPSKSPASAGFFFVKKKDGSLRPCIDYRALNDITVKFRYPLPLVPAALEQLRTARYFTKLDLRSAYNLIRIREGDEWKTAFSTTSGHYEYRVMPFGLANSPSVFQALVNDVFRDMLSQFVIVYIDDILIYSDSLDTHVKHVRAVLKRLIQHQLYAKIQKCEFHQTQISFLGYVISSEGVTMDDSKVQAVLNWPKPTTIKELQRFLGFANLYRRFIRSFSMVAAPLTSLLQGGKQRLNWTQASEQSFRQLKERFTSAPILHHPNPDLEFTVEVDASNTGIGAVLSQRQGSPLKLFPCAFYSRKLNPAERNYDVGDRELLAMKAAFEEWRHWLEGAKLPFLVLTDHRNLEYIRSAKRLNPRQARWSLFFSRFDFKVTYRPGSKNGKADALSRQFDHLPTSNVSEPILPSKVILAPVRWDIMTEISEALISDPAPAECPPDLTYVPSDLRPRVMQWVHELPSAGHPGINATIQLVSNRFWWSTLQPDVTRFVQQCEVCNISKSGHQCPAGLLQPLPIPQRPWSHVAIDFVTDLPSSNHFTTILTVIDRFSKACRLIPLTKLPTAFETAEALMQQVFRFYGLPEDIVSDRGPQFTSRVWKAFCQQLNINVSLTSGYHPESNGQVERLNQELIRFLRSYCYNNQNDWSRYLIWAEYAQNSLRKAATGLIPFQCILGFQPPLFPWSGEPSELPAVDDWLRRSEETWNAAHVHLQRAVRRVKE